MGIKTSSYYHFSMKKTYFNWSSGKDAALAFYKLKQDQNFNIDLLVTATNKDKNRVSMHGLRDELLKLQVEKLNLPLYKIELPEKLDMEKYDFELAKVVKELKSKGYNHCGFGDIFLEDLRKYREGQLNPLGLELHFPLWRQDTKETINEFIDLGFKAIIICTSDSMIDSKFLGREITKELIEELPESVDSCGENGEFHTFCYDGPIFDCEVKFTLGERVYREYPNTAKDKDTIPSYGFWYQDLIPVP